MYLLRTCNWDANFGVCDSSSGMAVLDVGDINCCGADSGPSLVILARDESGDDTSSTGEKIRQIERRQQRQRKEIQNISRKSRRKASLSIQSYTNLSPSPRESPSLTRQSCSSTATPPSHTESTIPSSRYTPSSTRACTDSTSDKLELPSSPSWSEQSSPSVIYNIYIHRTHIPRSRPQKTPAKPETVLIPALFACFGPSVGLFLFGWAARPEIHWVVPTIGIVIYPACVFILMQCVFLYIPGCYPQYAASVFAATDFTRSAFACGAVVFSRPLYLNLEVGKRRSLLAGLTIGCVLGVYLLFHYGEALRRKSRFVAKW